MEIPLEISVVLKVIAYADAVDEIVCVVVS
jgi:hypothetical protein